MGFRALPSGTRMTLSNLTVPACLVDNPGDLTTLNLTIENGRILALYIGCSFSSRPRIKACPRIQFGSFI